MRVDITKFSMVCRWSFPQSTGGVAMHNHYLLNALKNKFKCNSISAESEINSGFSKNNGIRYSRIPIIGYGAISQFLKFSILKNAARSFVDQKISRLFAEKLKKNLELLNSWIFIQKDTFS